MILDSLKVDYKAIDITEPGNEQECVGRCRPAFLPHFLEGQAGDERHVARHQGEDAGGEKADEAGDKGGGESY